MFMELLSATVLAGGLINDKIQQNKPYKHVMNTPKEVQARKDAQKIYDKARRDYEQRTGKKAYW